MMRVLIVSPHFPPVNAPDMQRVRMSLPYFREFGWEPHVLAVAPTKDDQLEPLLSETVPDTVAVERVPTLPLGLCRGLGIGNVALRALPFLYRAGSRQIISRNIDLVYFSTTMFWSMPLGRVWRWRFAVPYVLDLQDPWLSDYYETHPGSAPPPKYSLARRLHAALEPWTMKEVSALIAVSDGYLNTLRARYPWLTEEMCTTLPFGASALDFELLNAHPQPNGCFERDSGLLHGVYVGRGGDDMKPALRILFEALNRGAASASERFDSIRLHFVGTDYATDRRARQTVLPIACDARVEDRVTEQTARVPYFQALQLMKDADFLVLVGSDDPDYTASKVYPYLMAGKPILALLHERSSLVPLLRDIRTAHVVTFSDGSHQAAVSELLTKWRTMIDSLNRPTGADESALTRYSAREMARRQCGVFDSVLARSATRAA